MSERMGYRSPADSAHHHKGPYRLLRKAEKAWLLDEARKHVESGKLPELRKWITNSKRTYHDIQQLCKRWGIELPDDSELNR